MLLKQFEVLIEPVAKERPRFSTRSGFVRTHTAPKTKAFEARLINLCRPFFPVIPFLQALKLSLEFHVTPPLKKVRPLPSVRPDIDNYLKSVLDAFNEKMWRDDGQVVEINAKKVYHQGQPKIVVKIETA